MPDNPMYGTAASHLGSKSGAKPKGVVRPMKDMHIKELHDGTYHVERHHGHDHMGMPVHPPHTGSAADVDGIHDHVEEHFGSPNEGEPEELKHEKGESLHGEGALRKKQDHKEKPSKEHKAPHAEDDEKAENEEEVAEGE